jgi:hypothetical protein
VPLYNSTPENPGFLGDLWYVKSIVNAFGMKLAWKLMKDIIFPHVIDAHNHKVLRYLLDSTHRGWVFSHTEFRCHPTRQERIHCKIFDQLLGVAQCRYKGLFEVDYRNIMKWVPQKNLSLESWINMEPFATVQWT